MGLVVLVNKYDGIDLPKDACRVLALDGLPEAYGTLDRIDALMLEESDAMVLRQLQRIEQGTGRGIRSSDDFCVVLLLGSRLTQRIHTGGGLSRFSPATRAQLELSRNVAQMLRGRPFTELSSVVDQCLRRDDAWVRASRGALDGLQYDAPTRMSDVAIAQREAFDLAELGRYASAADRLRPVIDATTDRKYRGWLKQLAASYLHHDDAVAAQEMQMSAQMDNKALLKPRAGVAYSRLNGVADQSQRAVAFLRSKYNTGTELIIGVSALIDDLQFDEDHSAVSKFEQAMCDLGLHIGFASHRPERDTATGPDVLWAIGERSYLVIECKSGVMTDFIAKHDAAQLSHAVDWFHERYDESCEPVPVLVHRSAYLHKQANARSGTRVITRERLEDLREETRRWAQALAVSEPFLDPASVARQLTELGLNGKAFVDRWTTPVRKR